MKKTTTAIAGLAALTLLDVSAATPAAAQGAETFKGAYIGAHAGYASSSSTTFTSDPYIINLPSAPATDITVPGRSDKFDFDGALGGVHTGYNVVTPKNFLYGIEGDWTYLGHDDSVQFNSGVVATGGGDGAIFQHRSELELEWQGTIRGRAGFVSGNTLFFATAGIAFLRTDWNEKATVTDCGADGCGNANDQTFVRNHSDSDLLVGAVIGGGVEIAVRENIIIGAEYLYENFGSIGSVPFGHTTPGQRGSLGDLDEHKVRVRVSIKLGNPPQ